MKDNFIDIIFRKIMNNNLPINNYKFNYILNGIYSLDTFIDKKIKILILNYFLTKEYETIEQYLNTVDYDKAFSIWEEYIIKKINSI